MICCRCGKKIDKSYAPDYCEGLYCEKCTKELFLNSTLKTLDVPCEEYRKAEQDFAECLDKFKKAWQGVAQAIVDGLNGKHTQIVKETPKVDKCDGCIFRGEYQDMGATTPICKKGLDLAEAVKMRNDTTPCKYKTTWREVDEYVKRKDRKVTVIDELHEIPTGEKLATTKKPNTEIILLIRCKDCKWFNTSGCAIEIVDDSDKPTENDYCSFAERKEEE